MKSRFEGGLLGLIGVNIFIMGNNILHIWTGSTMGTLHKIQMGSKKHINRRKKIKIHR